MLGPVDMKMYSEDTAPALGELTIWRVSRTQHDSFQGLHREPLRKHRRGTRETSVRKTPVEWRPAKGRAGSRGPHRQKAWLLGGPACGRPLCRWGGPGRGIPA